MNEYETDPRRQPADSGADQPHPTAELPRADRGQSGSTDTASPGPGDAGHISPAGGQPGPAGPYPPSPWQPDYDRPAQPVQSGPPVHSGPPAQSGAPDWSGAGYPGTGTSRPGGVPTSYPTSGTGGYPTSGASGYPAAAASGGYPAAGGYPGAGNAGYPGAPSGGYPGQSRAGYPGAPSAGYPGAAPGGGGYPAGGAHPGQPGFGGPPAPWGTAQAGPARPSVPGRVGRALLFGVVALVLLAGSGIAGGVIALAFDDSTGGGGRTYTAAPIINSADLPGIAAAVQDSVVSISTGNSEGSGVVLTADGFVLTNNHVVAGAQGGAVRVVFADGKNVDAQVVGTDPPTDLAVLKAEDVSDLTAAKFGDSDAMRVGDTVLALGSPLGLQGSVTAGIISARDRSIATGGEPGGGAPRQGASSITGLLQTDAPINPGNSGGALVSTRGEVIGINTAIATSGQSNGNIGVGFAIPSNRAKTVAESLRRGEKVSHPYLGVSVTTREDGGALVGSVAPGSPAEKVGLRQGDVITRFGDRVVAESNDLVAAVQAGKVGDQVEVTYTRNGTENRATVTLAETS